MAARTPRFLLSALAIGAAIAASAATPALSADAFSALKGRWSGAGKATFAGGQSEKLRCSAQYAGGGANLILNLKCASPSAQINLKSDLSSRGNKVSGIWSESNFGQSGALNGSQTNSGLRLRVSGTTAGMMTIAVSGNRQSVYLSSPGSTMTGVSIGMGRR